MTKGWRIFTISVISLLPWGIVAIVTNWYNEKQPDGIHTLSVGHALILMMLQFGLGFGSYFLLEHWFGRKP